MKKLLLFALLGLALIAGALCFIPDAGDAEERNVYLAQLKNTLHLQDCFQARGVVYHDFDASSNGMMSSLNFYLDKDCPLPEELDTYFKENKLGYFMKVRIIKGKRGTNEVVSCRYYW